MQFHVTICPFCSRRSQPPAQATSRFPRPSSCYYWTAKWTGHCPPGGRRSQPVFLRSRYLHPAILPVGVEQILRVLSPCLTATISGLRAFSLSVRRPLVRSEGCRTDSQVVPCSSAAYSDCSGLG